MFCCGVWFWWGVCCGGYLFIIYKFYPHQFNIQNMKKGWWKLSAPFRTSWDSLVSLPVLPPDSGGSDSQMQFQLPPLCWWFLDCLLPLDTSFSVQIALSVISTCRCLTLGWNALWPKQALVFPPTHCFFNCKIDQSLILDFFALSWWCIISRVMPCLYLQVAL